MTTRERNNTKTRSRRVAGAGLGYPANEEQIRTTLILSDVDSRTESDAVRPDFKIDDRPWRVAGMGLGYVNDPRRK